MRPSRRIGFAGFLRFIGFAGFLRFIGFADGADRYFAHGFFYKAIAFENKPDY